MKSIANLDYIEPFKNDYIYLLLITLTNSIIINLR